MSAFFIISYSFLPWYIFYWSIDCHDGCKYICCTHLALDRILQPSKKYMKSYFNKLHITYAWSIKIKANYNVLHFTVHLRHILKAINLALKKSLKILVVNDVESNIKNDILGALEIPANLYCNWVHLYWAGCVICSIYLW